MSLALLSFSVAKIALSARNIPSTIYTCSRNVRGRNPHPVIKSQVSPDFLDTSEFENESGDLDLKEVLGGGERRDWNEFLSNVDLSDPEIINDLVRLEKQGRNKLKRQILKRKYFKKEREISILTWQAKEQIKYLNQEHPEEWTVDNLAESFPASRDGIILILKSSYIPRNHEEIRKHDDKAVRNIQLMKEKLEIESDTLEPGVKQDLEEKLKKIGNASGIKSLPLTELVTRSTLAAQSKLLRPANKIGPFQSMLMYYDKMTDNKNENYSILSEPEKDRISNRSHHKSYEQLGHGKGDNSYENKQLQSGKAYRGRETSQETEKVTSAKEERMNFNEMYDEQRLYNSNRYDSMNIHEDKNYLSANKNRSKPKTKRYHDDDYSKDDFYNEGQMSTSRRGGRGSKSFSIIEDKKTNASSKEMNFEGYTPGNFNERRSSKSEDISTRSPKFGPKHHGDINNLIPQAGTFQKWNTEPETYNADSFGKTVITKKPYIELKDRRVSDNENYEKPIKVPKRRKASYYKKGNMMYDNDGEFLFKIP